MEDRRIRLIERLCRLPEAQLPDVEALLAKLDGTAVSTPILPSSPANHDWPHAPVHRLSEHGTFIVTASTLHKQHHFRGEEALSMLETKLLQLAKQNEVILEA